MAATDNLEADTERYTKLICAICGGDQILRDAWVEWSPPEREWVLRSTFDNFWCETCDGEVTNPEWAALGKPQIIQIQNDRFRRGDAKIPGRRMITSGIQELCDGAGKCVQDTLDLCQPPARALELTNI